MPVSLLQAAEIAQTASAAAGAVTAHAKEQGAEFAILWFLVVCLGGLCVLFFLRAETATTTRATMVEKALAEARTEVAKQQAIDMAHAAEMQRQMREQYERELVALRELNQDNQRRLEEINRELRQQEGKSIEVIGATGQKMRELFSIVQDTNSRTRHLEESVRRLLGGPPVAALPRLFPNQP